MNGGSLFPQLEPSQQEEIESRRPGRSISFTVLGTPIAQGRGRATIVRGHAAIYDPPESRAWKQEVRSAASAALGKPSLIEGPIEVSLRFWFPRPSRIVWKTRPMPSEWMPCGKDVDNLAKSVLDALNSILWKDDSQVVRLVSEKRYNPGPGFGDERARVEVMVEVMA